MIGKNGGIYTGVNTHHKQNEDKEEYGKVKILIFIRKEQVDMVEEE